MEKSYTNKIVKVKAGSIVTLEQAKDQLNVEQDFVQDDSHILFLIESATNTAEDFTGTDIALTSNTLEFIRFNGSSIIIKEAPYKSIVSITTTTDDVDTILSEDDYEVQINITEFQILLHNAISDVDKLVVVFQTGYNIDEAPYAVTSAILVKINSLYDEERSSYMVGSNYRDFKTFQRLLSGHVVSRW